MHVVLQRGDIIVPLSNIQGRPEQGHHNQEGYQNQLGGDGGNQRFGTEDETESGIERSDGLDSLLRFAQSFQTGTNRHTDRERDSNDKNKVRQQTITSTARRRNNCRTGILQSNPIRSTINRSHRAGKRGKPPMEQKKKGKTELTPWSGKPPASRGSRSFAGASRRSPPPGPGSRRGPSRRGFPRRNRSRSR